MYLFYSFTFPFTLRENSTEKQKVFHPVRSISVVVCMQVFDVAIAMRVPT